MSTTTSVDSNQCAQCGAEISDCASTPIEARTPCPSCGSTHRRISVSAHTTMRLTASADAQVIRYESRLIDEARRLYSEDQHGLAIIIAHTACEVATRRVIMAALSQSGLPHDIKRLIQPAETTALIVTVERTRELFNAVTGKKIQEEGRFWGALKKSATLRNEMVHQGKVPPKESAASSIEAVSAFIDYALALYP